MDCGEFVRLSEESKGESKYEDNISQNDLNLEERQLAYEWIC